MFLWMFLTYITLILFLITMEFKYNIGEHLIIELVTKEIFEGEYVSGSDNRIELGNLFDQTSRNRLGSQILTFYKSEISNVLSLDKNKIVCPLQAPLNLPEKNYIKLSESEYTRLKNLSYNYTYVPCIDTKYYEAVEYLSTCENVSLVGLNYKLGRGSKLDLFVCSAWNQVYLFDLCLINKSAFPTELKSIIMDKDITKVVHDGRALADCLHYCHQVQMVNVFDTQIADMMVEKQLNKKELTKLRNLAECFNDHFNFPSHIFHKAMSVEGGRWNKRPVTDGTKHLASLLGTYLITLKNHLQKMLMKDFYDSVNKYHTSVLKSSAVEAQKLLSSSDVTETMAQLKLVE